jgi:hypothetical protein
MTSTAGMGSGTTPRADACNITRQERQEQIVQNQQNQQNQQLAASMDDHLQYKMLLLELAVVLN